MAIFVTSWTQAQPTGQLSLFRLVKSVQVTPAGNLLGGEFVRIGYVPSRNSIVVTFKAKLDKGEGGCTNVPGYSFAYGYAYTEYTTDMVETNKGVITCQVGVDVGGLFLGDDFYYAMANCVKPGIGKCDVDGWQLAKYNAVTWASLDSTFTYPLATGQVAADPMLAYVNGKIDISSVIVGDPPQLGPFVSYPSHHNFFTTDLKFDSNRILNEKGGGALSSLVVVGDTINMIAGTAILGDMIVIRYDKSWNHLSTDTLKKKSGCPEGAAFDGSRFYVAYLDVPCTTFPCPDNVRLAAFDRNWNLLDDIAVTSFSSSDKKQPNRPTLALRNGRLYVAYDQTENETFNPPIPLDSADLQVHVKVYELTPATGIVSPGGQSIFPDQLQLEQNYPNPFNPSTTIEYQLPSRAYINISIYNSVGQLVRVLYSGESSAGNHSIVWDSRDDSGRSVATGTYFYQVKVGDAVQTKKALLIK